MKIGAMILGVCHPQKLAWMPETIASVDKTPFFDKKVLAIDEFNGWTFPQSLNDAFRSSGWTVIKDSHKSRPKSMIHALEELSDCDVIFYHEDDVLVSLPDRGFIENIFNTDLSGRKAGMVSLTLGGTKGWFSFSHGVGDLAHCEQNKIHADSEIFAFLREEEGRDVHFFEFPGLFIRRDLLAQALKYSSEHCKNMQIEQGLTKAWFDNQVDKTHYKCSIAKNNLTDILRNEPRQIFNKCRLLTNLDPRQGSSPYFGCHTI